MELSPDASAQIEATLRQYIEARLGTSATKVSRLAPWSQVVLPPDIQDSLTELIARFKHRRKVFETWKYDRVVTTSRGVVAMFAGSPGTGKTMVAGAIANDLGVDIYRVDLSRIVSKWIGETEQNLAKLFDAAEEAHAIILFDEADSLFAKRTKVQNSVDRYANLEVNYLLQRLDSFEGIAILTTNFGSSIDRAFSRRLTVRITFPFPDEEMREKLWRAHLPKALPTAGELDLRGLAHRFKLSGGYIRNVALRAAFLAAEEHTPLTQEHLERAIRAEYREIGQLTQSSVLE
jgi:SpoVK/Ycf46/Vps4 family AAA+-type ATPase